MIVFCLHSWKFSVRCFGDILSDAQGFVPIQCSGITPAHAQGTICNARGLNGVVYMQGKYLDSQTMSLAPTIQNDLKIFFNHSGLVFFQKETSRAGEM